MTTAREHPLFSLSGAELFGSFSRRFTFVSLQGRAAPPSREEIQQKAQLSMDDAKQLALSRYAKVHEARHFHDAFGTVAGLAAFRLNFEIVLEFATFLKSYEDAMPNPPLVKRYLENGCPEAVKRFVRKQVLMDKSLGMICAAPRPVVTSGTEHWNVPLIEFVSDPSPIHGQLDLSPPSVICFPQALGLRESDGREFRGTRYIPIDFGTLTEANAQMLQRELAFHEFGQDMRQALVAGTFTAVTSDADPLAVLNSVDAPYDVVDFLLARAARAHGRNARIDPDTIFRVTERAMSRTRVLGTNDRVSTVLDTPAQTLQSLLNSEITPERLNGPALEFEDIANASAIKEWLEFIDMLPHWANIPLDGSLACPIIIMFSYVMNEVAKPLLTRKLDPEFLKRYTTLSGYLEMFPQLPAPFIVAHEAGFSVKFPEPHYERLLSAWVKYCFVTDLCSQMIDGPDVLLCPRRHGFLRQRNQVNFCSGDRTCDKLIGLGLCGEWTPGQSRELQNCLFSNALGALRLVPVNKYQGEAQGLTIHLA